MTSVPNELSTNVSKLVDLTKQLSEAKADIKVLNQEEKRLKETVKSIWFLRVLIPLTSGRVKSVFVNLYANLV